VEYAVLTSRALLGLVFMASTLSKIRSRAAFEEFIKSIKRLEMLPNATIAAILVIVGEGAVPLALAYPGTVEVGFLLTSVVLVMFIGAILLTLRRGNSVPCPCFGPSRTPLGVRHITRNVVLLGVALVAGVGTLLGDLGHAQAAGVAISLFIGVVLAVLLIRLDDLVDLFMAQSPE
jgi:uncharacterized membrane protein YphA (DoxX/SURF4 family)